CWRRTRASSRPPSSRLASGTAQATGQWIEVDLGHGQRIREVVLDAAPSSYGWPNDVAPSGDYPRGYRLSVSTDGQHWSIVRDGNGAGGLTTLNVPHHP